MNVLVTGVTGKTGRRVVESLVNRGVGVRALVRDLERGKMATLGMGVELVLSDFNQPESVAAAATGCDAMYLVSSDSAHQVQQEIAISKVSVDAGVQHIVKLSSSDAGQRHYRWSKGHDEIERTIAELGIGYSSLRPHFFMRNYFSLLKKGTDGAITLEAPANDGKIGAIDDFDIGECAAELLATQKPLGTHELLTGPENISMSRVAEAFRSAVGQRISYVNLNSVAYDAQLMADDPESGSDVADVYEEVRVGTMALLSENVLKITGNAPRTIEQFALENVNDLIAAIADASPAASDT